MADDSPPKPAANTGRFAVLTNPVRGFAERAVGRAWPGRRAKNPPAPVPPDSDVAGSGYETPAQSFVTSEVISAFHLQQLNLPSGVDRVTRGAATGGKVAIVVSAFALVSLIGLGLWASSPNTTADVTPSATDGAPGARQENKHALELEVPLGAASAPVLESAPASAATTASPPAVRERTAGSLSDSNQRRLQHSTSPGTAASPKSAATNKPPMVDVASVVPTTPAVVSAQPVQPSLEVPRIRRQPNTDE